MYVTELLTEQTQHDKVQTKILGLHTLGIEYYKVSLHFEYKYSRLMAKLQKIWTRRVVCYVCYNLDGKLYFKIISNISFH